MEQAINISQQTKRAKKKTDPSGQASHTYPPKRQQQNRHGIRNLSGRKLTDTEKAILTRGLNYNYRNANKTEFLATLEATLRTNNISEETQQTIRQTVIPKLTRRSKLNTLNTLERQTLEELQKDKNITTLPADEGRMTVILNKRDYASKAQALLTDKNTYRP
eukprot:g19100.t1